MRYILAALPAVLIIAAACGGSDDKNSPADATVGPTPTAAEAHQTADQGQLQPSAPDQPLPTPVPLAEDGIAIQVVGVGAPYAPTLSAFKALPTVEIQAEGQSYKGVTLATLAQKSKAASGVSATIDGVRGDGKRQGAVRFPLADIASNTVLVLAADGQISVASTSIPRDQWLIRVTSIAFR